MTKLRPFQIQGARQIHRYGGRALLADDQGLGKTIQSLYYLIKTPKRRPVVIITPASMKYTWQAEASLHFGMRTEVLEGKRRSRDRSLPGDIVILNYDILHSWLPLLQDASPKCVILDEVHFIKNLSAQRTKCVLQLASDVPSVIGLSGTPMTNRPWELWPVMAAIRPDIFPDRQKYAWRYCKPRYTPWGWKFDGATNLKELHKILKSTCMIRRLKRDVLPELPDKTRQPIFLRLDSGSMKEYRKAEVDFIEWLKAISPSKAKKAKRSQALTKVGYLLRLVSKLKAEWVEQWIAEFFASHPQEKLVAFTMHRATIDRLSRKFPGSVVVDGRVTGRLRTESVRKFQSNPRARLFLGNWKAAGVGITLTASRHCVALDLPWTPGDLVQGEDRIHRLGQKKNVIIYYLAALGTIEEKLIRILQRKAVVIDAVLDGKRSSDELDIFESLMKEVRQL